LVVPHPPRSLQLCLLVCKPTNLIEIYLAYRDIWTCPV
jgi:hypothetical protein